MLLFGEAIRATGAGGARGLSFAAAKKSAGQQLNEADDRRLTVAGLGTGLFATYAQEAIAIHAALEGGVKALFLFFGERWAESNVQANCNPRADLVDILPAGTT